VLPTIEGADLIPCWSGSETEFASLYLQTNLPQQFDEYVWFDETHAVTQPDNAEIKGLPDTYPFGV
jgi:hypothetical protein